VAFLCIESVAPALPCIATSRSAGGPWDGFTEPSTSQRARASEHVSDQGPPLSVSTLWPLLASHSLIKKISTSRDQLIYTRVTAAE